MNKFKKGLIMALAVGVLMMGSVFGATTADFTITTKVAGVAQIGIFDDKQTGNSVLGTGITGIEITGLGESAVAETVPYYVAIRTNAKTSFSVDVTSTDFLLDNISGDNDVKYNVRFGLEGTTTVVSGDFIISGGTTLTTLTSDTSNGLHVYNYPFAISLTEAQSQSAVVGTYTATMTFELTTY